VDAKTVKSLRDATGAGMMDCKKALLENEGDMDAAMEFLRKKGLAQADKKASRSASEGIVETYVHTGEWTPSNQLAHPSAGGDAQHGASSCRLEARRDGRGQLRDGLRR
jgi:hypothetical protein